MGPKIMNSQLYMAEETMTRARFFTEVGMQVAARRSSVLVAEMLDRELAGQQRDLFLQMRRNGGEYLKLGSQSSFA